MKYKIDREELYSLATITEEKSDTVAAYVTVDIHNEHLLKDQAAQLMYSDALLSGAGDMSREEFLSAVNMLGATISISISQSILTISLKSTKAQFKRLVKLVELMMVKPTFSKGELTRIKTTVINELHEAKENSKQIAHAELRNAMYGQSDRKYTYGIDETISAASDINVGHLKALHKRVLSQMWTCSIASEELPIKALLAVIKTIKKNSVLPRSTVGMHQQKTPKQVAVFNNIPSRTNIDFSLGAPLPITLHHPDYIPLTFALAVLAKWGGFAGRLMSTVREKEGLTYGIYGMLEGFTGTEQGYWRIMTFFAPDKAVQGLTSTLREITLLYNKGITADELNQFKTVLSTQQALLKDSVYSQLKDLHAYHCQQFTLSEMKTHKGRIDTLTLDEVNEVIKTYLNPRTVSISCAGPVSSVKKNLQSTLKK